MPALAGLVGLGTEGGLWYLTQQNLQAAADSAAISAATSYALDSKDPTSQANAVTASYGYVDATNGASVSVNLPPKSGSHLATPGAVEVIVNQSQARLFSALWNSKTLVISARAVAAGNGGSGCVLALDPTASGALSAQGSANIDLKNCSLYDDSSDAAGLSAGGSSAVSALSAGVVGGVSGRANFTTTQGLVTGHSVVQDPYATTNFPSFSGCDHTHFNAKSVVTIDPGVYCGGMTVRAGAIVTLNPGIYYFDGGSLTMNGGATLNGSGVTLVFTSSTGAGFGGAQINGGATVNLTAPTSGATAGIVLFGDRNMPVGTSFNLTGGGSQVLEGAIYLPEAAVTYAGGASTSTNCTQLIGDTIAFTGNASLTIDCRGSGTKPIGATASLFE
jgi:hypothetical protein